MSEFVYFGIAIGMRLFFSVIFGSFIRMEYLCWIEAICNLELGGSGEMIWVFGWEICRQLPVGELFGGHFRFEDDESL